MTDTNTNIVPVEYMHVTPEVWHFC